MKPLANRAVLRSGPDVGFLVPGFLVRVVFALVAAGLCISRLPVGFWLIVAFATIILAVVSPRSLAGWALMIGLGADQIISHAAQAGVGFAVLIAGVHLLHVLGAQMAVIPRGALVQASVLGRPLLRFVAIQLPVQALALVALAALTAGRDGPLPALGILGAVALIALALLLIAPLVHERARDRPSRLL